MPGQRASVQGMDKVATSSDSKFVVALGDNFYYTGVEDENSQRFRTTWDSLYSPASLQTPWYVIAGNHDWKGNVSAQIAHSKRVPRWNFPSEYHAHKYTADDGATIDLILIDTSSLASSNAATDESEPGYFDPLPEVPRAFAEEQWSWIEAQLQASTADYVLVGGHYPVYSVCHHGNTDTLVTNLKPLLERYGAHYMSGHDHCMEHLAEGPVHYFLSGMGDTCCYRANKKDSVPAGSLKWYKALDNKEGASAGFTSFSVGAAAMTATFHDQDGAVLYTTAAISPRSADMKAAKKL